MRIFLFSISIVLFTTISTYTAKADYRNLDKETETKYWKFIQERAFLSFGMYQISILETPIYISCNNSTEVDDSIVKGLVKELSELIPNQKISYRPVYNNKKVHGRAIKLWFNDLEINTYRRWSVNTSTKKAGKRIMNFSYRKPKLSRELTTVKLEKEQIPINMYFEFDDTVSYNERKKYIEFAVVRSLVNLNWYYFTPNIIESGSIFNNFDYSPGDSKFSEVDKFFLSKIYSDDFEEQYARFLKENYSWRQRLLYSYLQITLFASMGFYLPMLLTLLILVILYKFILNRKYRFKYFRYLIPSLLIASIFIFSGYFYSLTRRMIGSNVSEQTYSSFWLDYFLFAIVASAILFLIENYLIKRLRFEWQLTLKILLTLVLLTLFSNILVPYLAPKLDTYFMTIYGFVISIGRGIFLFHKHSAEAGVRQKELEISQLKEMKTRAEIESLHARINPHFLYNSLNSIASLSHRDAEKTEQMAISLSDLFRYTINREGNQTNHIKDEVEMVRNYLEIEQIRFGDRLTYQINIDDGVEDITIPKFILQPLVENAIKHGISKIENNGIIELTIKKSYNGIIISVSDNGPDFPEGLVSGYGLQSLQDMLTLNYGDQVGIDWQNKPQKAITISIHSLLCQ